MARNRDHPKSPARSVAPSSAELLESRCLLSGSLFTVTNTRDSGDGSLRQAILDADASKLAATIQFQIPRTDGQFTGTGPLIYISSNLPPLSNAKMLIDGHSEDTFLGSDPNATGGPPIDIRFGILNDGPTNGITVTGSSCRISGLAVDGFPQSGILVSGATGTSIQGCNVGVAADGVTAMIPFDFMGTPEVEPLGNGIDGIEVTGSSKSTTIRDSLISNNTRAGVEVHGNSTGTTIAGNLIGVTVTGRGKLGNKRDGVLIDGGASLTTVGGKATDRNIIADNGGGVEILDAATSQNTVVGNYIGLDSAGQPDGNTVLGVSIQDSPQNTIGGTGASDVNVISANGGTGVQVFGTTAVGNIIAGDYIGTTPDGTRAAGNLIGVVAGAGLTDVGSTTVLTVISGNSGDGIEYSAVAGLGSIVNCRVGTNAAGTAAVPNGAAGIEIQGSGVGVGDTLHPNLVSGNATQGILLNGTKAATDTVDGNIVGLAADGTTPLGNGREGILLLNASRNTVQRNTVDANILAGVALDGTAASNVVRANVIGFDSAGAAHGNLEGVFISGSQNTIGGTAAADANYIGGNRSDGIQINGAGDTAPASNNLVEGNFIGTDRSGTRPLPNLQGVGLLGTAHNNTIGGAAAGDANVISGNTGHGVGIFGSSVTANIVQGNFIGTTADGVTPIGNGQEGVIIVAPRNTIGGTAAGDGNVIAHNGATGVTVTVFGPSDVATGDAIEGNSIFANARLGIDLGGDGPTPNSPGGPHAGPNRLQNSPVLGTATDGVAGYDVTGTLNSTPNEAFRIELFVSPSGGGPVSGKRLVGFLNINTDGSGNGSFHFQGSTPLPAGVLTATATDGAGDTSEFSGTQTPQRIGDANGDGTVSFPDLLILAQHYGTHGAFAAGDFNGDGFIGFSDLLELAQNYGSAIPPATRAGRHRSR